MRINAVAVIGLISFLAACNGEGKETTPVVPSPAPKTESEPTPPQPPPSPSPTVAIDLMQRQCDHNEDCLLVPSGRVCGEWSHESINKAHADGYRNAWREAAVECSQDTSVNAFAYIPDHFEARCPGPREFCHAMHFEDESCLETFVQVEESERLPHGGDFMFRTDAAGRYRVTLKGDVSVKKFRILDGDCNSDDAIIVTCSVPGVVCEDNAYFDGGERHTVKTDGCEAGCDILVEYLGPSGRFRR